MKIGKLSSHGTADQKMTDRHLQLPAGSNLTRPVSSNDGMIRYNTSTGGIEGFSRGWWSDFLTTAEFQVPGAQIDEDENVTIASLAILLSQFQRTVTGGVDLIGPSSSHDVIHGDVVPIPSPLTSEFAYLSADSGGILPPVRGTIDGYKDTAGKGPHFIAATSSKINQSSRPAWNIPGYTSLMNGNTFQQIIDPYKSTGFPEDERHNYLLEYFTGVYNTNWRSSGYTILGGDSYLTPAWDILDPYNDPMYGKLLLTVNLRSAAAVLGTSSQTAAHDDIFIKWYVKFVKFKGFKLKSTPGFTPGAGSSPMPTDPATGLDAPPTISIKGDTRGLILKDYLMRRYPTWKPTGPITVTVHIEPDKALYSIIPDSPTLDCTGFPAGSVINIKNEGYVLGGGGRGGDGGGWVVDNLTKTVVYKPASSGQSGGTSILCDTNVTTRIDNTNGTIAGGGGGGGGGAARNIWGSDKVFAAGSGGGSGGPINMESSLGAAGQGITYTIVGNTPEIKAKGWDSTGGTTGTIRSGSGVQLGGGTYGTAGKFVIPSLSGGVGSAGGSAGTFGTPGKSVDAYPNVSIVGWQLSAGGGPSLQHNDWIEIDGTRVTFVTGGAGAGEYQLLTPHNTNNEVWLQTLINTNVLDSNKYDIHVFGDATGKSIGEILDPTGGTFVWRELVLGLVLVSKSTNSSAETWTVNFNSQSAKAVAIQPTGSTSSPESAGTGGSPGNALQNSIVSYGTIDLTTTPAGFTADAAGEGTIIGPVS